MADYNSPVFWASHVCLARVPTEITFHGFRNLDWMLTNYRDKAVPRCHCAHLQKLRTTPAPSSPNHSPEWIVTSLFALGYITKGEPEDKLSNHIYIIVVVIGITVTVCFVDNLPNLVMSAARPLGTNSSEILMKIHTCSFKKIHLKMLSGKWRPFCLGLKVLRSSGREYQRVGRIIRTSVTLFGTWWRAKIRQYIILGPSCR